MSPSGPIRTLPTGFTSCSSPPPLSSYLLLRSSTGLSPKTALQALPLLSSLPTNPSKFIYVTTAAAEPVGMGRVISDGGWYYTIADIAVMKEYQGRGIGDYIVGELMSVVREESGSRGGYVTLIADGEAKRLYRKHGFEEPTESVGMHVVLE